MFHDSWFRVYTHSSLDLRFYDKKNRKHVRVLVSIPSYSHMTASATQCASPPVKIYHGFEITAIGRQFEPRPRSFLGLHQSRNFFVSRGDTFPPGRKSIPLVERCSAARATRYDDISFCMSKRSKTRENFKLDEL
jgi:hypothetical protein